MNSNMADIRSQNEFEEDCSKSVLVLVNIETRHKLIIQYRHVTDAKKDATISISITHIHKILHKH